ncbi:MAG: GNAT family N-acetyltransferase [Chloroflexi bacterium]|nr:GNAT family N-acetyltransferase [Chloroflexota bacterium]
MELYGTRVIIRAWERHDDELADAWPPYNDPLDPLWNLPRRLSFGPEMWSSIFENGIQRRSWAVEQHDGTLIGRISLREIDERRSQARLGVTFGAPYVGRGLGTEALTLFLEYYFESLQYRMMVLDVAAPNQRAVRCYTRLGFRYVDSDWRDAGSLFDRHILELPKYAQLRRYFREDPRGLKVEFYEMQLGREEWARRRAMISRCG